MSVSPALSWIEGDPVPLCPLTFRSFVRSIVRPVRKPYEACPEAVHRLLAVGTSLPGFDALFRSAVVWRGAGTVIEARPLHDDLAGIDSATGELLSLIERAGGRVFVRLSRSPDGPGAALLVLSPRWSGERCKKPNRSKSQKPSRSRERPNG